MYNTIIIGAGPAGISAGIYLIRAGIDVLIIENNTSSLLKAGKIENYFGFTNPISGLELLNSGKKQFEKLGGTIVSDEIITITFDDNLQIVGKQLYECKKLIIATGASRLLPNINGLKEGPHISFCAVCDGFFYRDKKVAVLGSGLYAMAEAKQLLNVTDKVTLLTNQQSIENSQFIINDDLIEHIENDNKQIIIYFTNKKVESYDGLFIAEGVAGSCALAKKIGILLKDNKIVVNENKQTNVPNIYAVGDCIDGPKQIAKAIADGMVAALDIIRKKN